MINSAKRKIRRHAIKYVKDNYDRGDIRKREFRDSLVKKIKKIGYDDQLEQNLANLFLDNNQVAIFTGLFYINGDKLFISWLENKYDEFIKKTDYSSEIVNKFVKDHLFITVTIAERKIFQSMQELVTESQLKKLKSKSKHYRKMIKEYYDVVEEITEYQRRILQGMLMQHRMKL